MNWMRRSMVRVTLSPAVDARGIGVPVQNGAPPGVALDPPFVHAAPQVLVAPQFHAFQSVGIHPHKPQDVPGQQVVGIEPLAFLHEIDARQVQRPDLLGLFRRDQPPDPDETAVAGKVLGQFPAPHPQDGSQRPGHFLRMIDLVRFGEHRIRLQAHRQGLAVPVQDLTRGSAAASPPCDLHGPPFQPGGPAATSPRSNAPPDDRRPGQDKDSPPPWCRRI